MLAQLVFRGLLILYNLISVKTCCLNVFVSVDVSVSIDFPSILHRTAYNYFRANGFRDHLRDVPRDDVFQLDAPAAGTNFCE